MTQLQEAMAEVDRNPGVGGAGEPFEKRHERPKLVAAETQTPEIAEIVASRAAKVAERRAHALSALSLAMEAGNHPRHCWSPAAATMAWTMAEILIAVMDSPPVELPAPLRQASAAPHNERAQAVAKAMAGDDAA